MKGNEAITMTLDEIAALGETTNREVEFVLNGHHTGWHFDLRPETSDEVQKCMRVFNSKVRKTMTKRQSAEFDALVEQHADDLRVAHVAGWRYEAGIGEGRPTFSAKELRAVLRRRPFGLLVGAFIDREVGTLEDFFDRSENS